jgi:hypothetical protein
VSVDISIRCLFGSLRRRFRALAIALARPYAPVRLHLRFVHAEHFQPTGVFLNSVSDEVRAYDITLRPIALGKINHPCALGTEDIHPKAKCFTSFSISVHVFLRAAIRAAAA